MSGHLEPVYWCYDAAEHCDSCARLAGADADGWEDSEGNPAAAVYSWDSDTHGRGFCGSGSHPFCRACGAVFDIDEPDPDGPAVSCYNCRELFYPAAELHAFYLGVDAALAAASWIYPMAAEDAVSILEDVDPAVLDQYEPPNLSGEFADGATPLAVARECGLPETAAGLEDAADRWEDGRDSVWSTALEAVALRVLDRVADATVLEDACERAAKIAREEYLRAEDYA